MTQKEVKRLNKAVRMTVRVDNDSIVYVVTFDKIEDEFYCRHAAAKIIDALSSGKLR